MIVCEKNLKIPYRDPDPLGWRAKGRAIIDGQNQAFDEEQAIRHAEEQVAMKAHRAKKLEEAGQEASDHLGGNPLDWWPFRGTGAEPSAPPKSPSEYDIATPKGAPKIDQYPDWDHRNKKEGSLGGTTLSHRNYRG